jgi:hypothetical protein
MVIIPPENIPPDPRPAMERPTMKDTEFGAAPHKADPTSNMKMQVSRTYKG